MLALKKTGIIRYFSSQNRGIIPYFSYSWHPNCNSQIKPSILSYDINDLHARKKNCRNQWSHILRKKLLDKLHLRKSLNLRTPLVLQHLTLSIKKKYWQSYLLVENTRVTFWKNTSVLFSNPNLRHLVSTTYNKIIREIVLLRKYVHNHLNIYSDIQNTCETLHAGYTCRTLQRAITTVIKESELTNKEI